MRGIQVRITLLVLVVVFCVTTAALGAKPICRSPANPKLFSFRGNDHVKLIGYDCHELLNTAMNISKAIDWRTGNKVYYKEFIDMLVANEINMTRVFVSDGWANDRFPWKRILGKHNVTRSEQRYARVDLGQWDKEFWRRARRILEYASDRGVVFEITLYDECGFDGGPGDQRWNVNPLNPDNSIPGTIGWKMIPRGMKDGLPDVYDVLNNPALRQVHEAYLEKWVTETAGLDNVIFEICNESTAGLAFHRWVTQYLRQTLNCPFLIAANTFTGKDQIYRLPEVDLIATHGHKSPREMDKIASDWKKYGKIVVVNTSGWYDSETNWRNTLRAAQQALDLDTHFDHKARQRKKVGPNGELFIELLEQLEPNSNKPAAYRLDMNRKVASVTLGKKIVSDGLSAVGGKVGDGWTTPVVRKGIEARGNLFNNPGSHKGRYMYFEVDDYYIYRGDHRKVTIEVQYFDEAPPMKIVVQYDGSQSPYQEATPIMGLGTNKWKRATVEIDDAYFANRQNGAADFRFGNGATDRQFCIRRVWVHKR